MDILRYLSYLPLRRSRILSVAARFFCMPVCSIVLHRHSALEWYHLSRVGKLTKL